MTRDKTSRFAGSLEELENDVAMLFYRKQEVEKPHQMHPAEWIAALHQEHYQTLDELVKSKATTESERVVKILSELTLLIGRMQRAHTTLRASHIRLSDVFGEIPVVEQLAVVDEELSRVTRVLGKITKGKL